MKKHKKLYGLVVALLAVSTLFGGASSVSADTSPPQVEKQNEQLSEIAEQYFSDTAAIVVNGIVPMTLQRSDKFLNNEAFDRAVDRYRQRLAESGETYSSSRTETVIESSDYRADGSIRVIAQETTYLTMEQENVETGYSAKHELTFAKDDNGMLELVDDVFLEPTGLLPLSEAEQLVRPDSAYFAEDKNEESSGELQPLSDYEPASIDRRNSSDDVPDKTLLRGGYNYSAMASYLERYWSNYNGAYRSFNEGGGDCTNFAGQALRAGGWSDVGGCTPTRTIGGTVRLTNPGLG